MLLHKNKFLVDGKILELISEKELKKFWLYGHMKQPLACLSSRNKKIQ